MQGDVTISVDSEKAEVLILSGDASEQGRDEHRKIYGKSHGFPQQNHRSWIDMDAQWCSSMFIHHLKWFDDLYSCCSITLEHIGTTPASIDVQVLHCRSPLRWVPTSSWTRIRWRLGIFWGSPEKFLGNRVFHMLQWRNITMVTWKIVVDWQSGDV